MIIKNIIIYVLLCILAYGFYYLFIGYLSYYILIITIITPLISFILLLLNIKRSELSFKQEKITLIQDQTTTIEILKNSPAMGYVRLNNHALLKETNNHLPYSSKHCGGYIFDIQHYKQYDALNIFYITKKNTSQCYITILPKEIEYNLSFIIKTLPHHEEVYSTTQKGDDPTEIFDIHDYRQGDQLKNIHWKLSSKYQKLLIKENALALNQYIYITCLFNDKDKDNDLVFQYLNYFCLYLLQHKYSFMLNNTAIETYEQYNDILNEILWSKHTDSYHHVLYLYCIDYDGIHYVR